MPLFKPSIAALKQKRDVAGLAGALKSKDRQTRRDALKALADLEARAAVPALIELLLVEDGDLQTKVDVAELLRKLADGSAVPALLKANAVSQERERARIKAAIASSDHRYRDGLYVNLISAEETTLRSSIAAALGEIGGCEGLRALFEQLASETGPMERNTKDAIKMAIVNALGKNDPGATQVMCDLLKHESPEIRGWAAHCLGEAGDPSSQAALLRIACDDQQPFSVRQYAIASLGQIGDERAIPDLENLSVMPNRVLARDARQSAELIRQRRPKSPALW
ncbi:MAG: HEAT repeat domain-containing protein [Chloroflexi bacterium]|nr:HEAT repeat domain-containing protein [Chloroflexota bacterium]